MVKKAQKKADKKHASNPFGAGLLDTPFAATVRDSAQQIWLAGLGAFSKAQAEGGKVFESLVKDGVDLQRKTQSAAEDKLGEVSSRMSSVAGEVSAKAGQQWDKLESIFEDRTAKALGKLGIPTAKDMDALVSEVKALRAEVARLSGGKAATPASGKKATPAKTAAPKAPAKKTSTVRKRGNV